MSIVQPVGVTDGLSAGGSYLRGMFEAVLWRPNLSSHLQAARSVGALLPSRPWLSVGARSQGHLLWDPADPSALVLRMDALDSFTHVYSSSYEGMNVGCKGK